MKIFKLLVSFLALVAVFTACEEDIITNYAFQDISAPQNVAANFDVTQDDSGLVTITPVGEGASSFMITSGIEGDTPVTVNAGESANFTYTEGEYLVKIVATGATGLTSEYNQSLTIAFTAPENLAFETQVSGLTATVTPTADNAAQFDVYFGLGDDEEPVTIMAGESASYEYAEAGTYAIRVVAKAASVTTLELTKSVLVAGAVEPIVLPITFDDPEVNYDFVTFNGANFEVVTNPDLSGANTAATNVGAITNTGNEYEGGTFELGTPVDFSGSNKTITMKFWSDTPTPVLLKFEGGVSGERQTEVVKNHGGTGWEVLTFDFATEAIKSYIDGTQGVGEAFVPDGQYAKMTIIIDGPGKLAGTFYIDDISQPDVTDNTVPQFPITHDNNNVVYDYVGFGAADYGAIPAMVIDNPDKSGINTTAKVLSIEKPAGAQTYAGASLKLNGPIDFSSGTTVRIMVWSPRVGTPILFKIEDTSSPADANGNPTVFAEVQQTTTVAQAWEELSFDMTSSQSFSTSENYDRVITFPDFGSEGQGETYYFDEYEVGEAAKKLPQLPITNENSDVVYDYAGFGAADYGAIPVMVIDNPDKSGINTTAKVVSIEKPAGAQTYAGASLKLAGPIDFSSGTTIQVKVWSPRAGTPILFKIEDTSSPADGNGNPSVFVEVQQSTTVAEAWEELSFDLTSSGSFSTSINYDNVILFPDFGSEGLGETYYFDDIAQQ